MPVGQRRLGVQRETVGALVGQELQLHYLKRLIDKKWPGDQRRASIKRVAAAPSVSVAGGSPAPAQHSSHGPTEARVLLLFGQPTTTQPTTGIPHAK